MTRPRPLPAHLRRDRDDKGVIWKPGPNTMPVRAEHGVDLAHYVAKKQGGITVRSARRLLDGGHVRVNGRVETFGSRKLKVGDVVEIFAPAEDREHVFDPKRVLLDRDGVIAYDKPAWLPVQRGDSPKDWSLHDILKAACGPLIAVHRLDADTSGIVLFAKEEKIARRLETAFREHNVKKTYQAIVRGHPRDVGSHRSYLVKVASGRGFERWKSGRGHDAREAVTTWEVIERIGAYASRIQVEPQSGRHHQIRIHFSEMGHPIYGDRLYGDRADPIHVDRHLLHAWRCELAHPGGGEAIRLEAPLPREFSEAAKRLRKL